MTISVLLPTRNGGRLISSCVESVLTQEGADFELVVSDNANDDATPDILAGYADDPRLRVVRQDQLLGVTDNWNATLEAATGDYVLMIGDDDLLLPGCLAQLQAALRESGNPDCMTFNAVRFIAADALSGVTSSWWGKPYFDFDERFRDGEEITDTVRRDLIREIFRFEVPLPLTMQLTVVSRTAAQRARCGFYRSPFPDHYAIGVLLLGAERWVYRDFCPLIIGVSAKSFGQFFFNGHDGGGLSYLGVTPGFAGELPGSPVTNAMTAWMVELRHDYADLLNDVGVSRSAYVVRQAWYWYGQWRAGRISAPEFRRLTALLSRRDVAGALGHLLSPGVLRHTATAVARRRGTGDRRRAEPLFRSLSELPDGPGIAAFAGWYAQRESHATPAA